MSEAKGQESKTYQAMLEEVERIVSQVANENLDLDALVGQVEKGYGIIKAMRARLDETRGKIEKLRLEYEAEEKPQP